DLNEGGLLARTLIAVWTEFGRSPDPGRSHWPGCFSVVMAGGAVQGGRPYGVSDARGAYPADRRVTPADLVATIYHALGIDYKKVLMRRPVDGNPIAELV